MVYKLVEVDGIPVAKRASHKASVGGAKSAVRLARASGTVAEEVVYRTGSTPDGEGHSVRPLQIPLVRGGEPVADVPSLTDSRAHLADGLVSLLWRLGAFARRSRDPDPLRALGEPPCRTRIGP